MKRKAGFSETVGLATLARLLCLPSLSHHPTLTLITPSSLLTSPHPHTHHSILTPSLNIQSLSTFPLAPSPVAAPALPASLRHAPGKVSCMLVEDALLLHAFHSDPPLLVLFLNLYRMLQSTSSEWGQVAQTHTRTDTSLASQLKTHLSPSRISADPTISLLQWAGFPSPTLLRSGG